jgi:putative ABC transport system permease protein
MNAIQQIYVVSLMNLQAIRQRVGASLVIVVGMAAVVAVMLSMLSMSNGFLESVNKTGRPDRAIVTSSGATSETASNLSRDAVALIADAPGVKRAAGGKPAASADVFAYLDGVKKSDGLTEPATIHGVGPEGFTVLPQVKLISGRMFKPGLRELIVGRMMQSEFVGYEVGDRLVMPDGEWRIVGSFASQGDQHESELLGDTPTVMSAYRRSGFNSVVVLLNSPQAFDTFKDALTTNPALNVDVTRETAYFAKLSKPLNDFLTVVAYAVGAIMGLGAVFGALNTMYSAVSTRSREIATLRAIGFGAAPVVASVLVEALLLTLIGACLGAAIASLLFDGRHMVSD